MGSLSNTSALLVYAYHVLDFGTANSLIHIEYHTSVVLRCVLYIDHRSCRQIFIVLACCGIFEDRNEIDIQIFKGQFSAMQTW